MSYIPFTRWFCVYIVGRVSLSLILFIVVTTVTRRYPVGVLVVLLVLSLHRVWSYARLSHQSCWSRHIDTLLCGVYVIRSRACFSAQVAECAAMTVHLATGSYWIRS